MANLKLLIRYSGSDYQQFLHDDNRCWSLRTIAFLNPSFSPFPLQTLISNKCLTAQFLLSISLLGTWPVTTLLYQYLYESRLLLSTWKYICITFLGTQVFSMVTSYLIIPPHPFRSLLKGWWEVYTALILWVPLESLLSSSRLYPWKQQPAFNLCFVSFCFTGPWLTQNVFFELGEEWSKFLHIRKL